MLENFDAMKARLESIVDEVSSDDISLDDALKLYEEAVNIGLSACDASEIVDDSAPVEDINSDTSVAQQCETVQDNAFDNSDIEVVEDAGSVEAVVAVETTDEDEIAGSNIY